MDDLLGRVISWILDVIIPPVRRVLGNWGCFRLSILISGILVWFLPAYVLWGHSDDWKSWLVVGPLATVALVVMITSTYGLMKGSSSKGDEQAVTGQPQQPSEHLSVTPESQPQRYRGTGAGAAE